MCSFATTTVLSNTVPSMNDASVISQNQLSNSLLTEDHVLQLQTLHHNCLHVNITLKFVATNIFL